MICHIYPMLITLPLLPRVHGIELHERPWYPAALRRIFQDGLASMLTRTGAYRHAAEPFARLLQRTGARSVLDLCSGGAEPSADLCRRVAPRLQDGKPPTLWLSDLYPNVERFEQMQAAHPDVIRYIREPVDARKAPTNVEVPRVRTLFTSMHHFEPDEARAILADAAHSADGIAIFEASDRTVGSLLCCIGVFFCMSVATGFSLRPWRPLHLVLGVLIPVVPLTALFDGLMSCMRSYHPEELQDMVAPLREFEWEAGTFPMAIPATHGVYLIGWRKKGVVVG
jgi:hypothetical protein